MEFFTKKEIKALLISILIVALAFGFDDKKPSFDAGYWFANLFRMFMVVAIAFLMKEFVRKLVAKTQGFDTEYGLWNVKRYRLKPEPAVVNFLGKSWIIKSIPAGAILSVLVTLVSKGKLFFVAIGSYDLIIKKSSRFGKKTFHITDYDEAKIAVVGPLVNVALMIIFQFFNSRGTFDNFVYINGMIAAFHMIPISSLDGAKIFFGSKIMYMFTLAFVLGTVLLIKVLAPAITLALAGIFAIIFASIYYYYRIYK